MSTSTISFDEQSIDPVFDRSTNICLSSLNQTNILAWPQQPLIQIAPLYSDSTLDVSSTGSFPSDERPSPDSNWSSVSHDIPLQPVTACHEDSIILKNKMDSRLKPERGHCKSKNLLTERNRRQRIHDGILSLRALVPKITKVYRSITLLIEVIWWDWCMLLIKRHDCPPSCVDMFLSKVHILYFLLI